MTFTKRHFLLLTAGLVLVFPTVHSRSQLAPVTDPLSEMQTMQTANDDLIKRQEATLKELTDMTATANEVRIFSRRS